MYGPRRGWRYNGRLVRAGVALAVLPLAAALAAEAGRAGYPGRPEPLLFSFLGKTVPDEALHYAIPEGLTEKAVDQDAPRWSVNRALPPQAGQFEALGYVPYVTDFMDLAFPESAPRASQLSDALQLRATPGEIETGAFAIYALKALNKVRVTLTPLRAVTGKATIPRENVNIRSAFCMRRLCWRQPHFTVQPVILEERPAVAIAPRQSQLYYVTVQVPAGTPSGRYVTRIKITAADAGTYELPLALEVLPFTLASPERLYAFWYHENVPRERRIQDFAAMRLAGMNSVMTSLTDQACGVRVTGTPGAPTFDFSDFKMFMADYVAAGFTRPLIFNLVIKQFLDLDEQAYRQLVLQMDELAVQNHWPGFIWNLGDECDANESSLATAKDRVARLNQIVPNDLTKMTIVFPENHAAYGSAFDILVWAGYFDGTLIEKTRSLGVKLGAYNGTGAYEIDPRDNRFFFGLWSWDAGLDHVEQWVFNECLYDKDQPFNDISKGAIAGGRGNCHYYCYPGPGGPLPTVGYYGVMEGVDDARYLYTLEQAITAAQKRDDPRLRYLAGQATGFLNAWRRRLDLSPLPDRNQPPYFTIIREVDKIGLTEYGALRDGCADLIVRLNAALGQ
jgi:hypothetical protein